MQANPPQRKRGKLQKRINTKKKWFFRLLDFIIWYLLEKILGLFNFHPKSLLLTRRGMQLTNPTSSSFPMETNAMVSKILAGGVWNYGFFQFHKEFYFPYWAHRQYNPQDKSFIPRSHNLLSINQTNRNWVSISFPGAEEEVSVDSAAAIMPGYDTYTIEIAIIEKDGIKRPHDYPYEVKFELHNSYSMTLEWRDRKIYLEDQADGLLIKGSGKSGIILSIRPFNMENACFINKLEYDPKQRSILSHFTIQMKENPHVHAISSLYEGDAYKKLSRIIKKKNGGLLNFNEQYKIKKKKASKLYYSKKDMNGVITSAFFYEEAQKVEWKILRNKRSKFPYRKNFSYRLTNPEDVLNIWFPALFAAEIPEPYNRIMKNMVHHLITLWDIKDIKPGSFTYHHFWIRDAVMMLYAFLLFGGQKAVRYILNSLPRYVNRRGLFQSQEGEWDSNGQALWIIGQYTMYSKDISYIKENKKMIVKMIQWIDKTTEMYSGVLPPGFSAEHLGVADWYLWDNFWALGGLDSFRQYQDIFEGIDIDRIFNKIHLSIEKYLKDYKYYPAALGRKKDAGMIGSIISVYPLKIKEYFNQKMVNTLEIIEKEYFYEKGFYQENIHSGINPYLTLEMAESFLYMGYYEKSLEIFDHLMKRLSVGDTFPEALHPGTNGGCMGDGFHGWAFAESFIFLRNIFVLEFQDNIIFFSGLPETWLRKKITMENVYTKEGKLNIKMNRGSISIEGFNAKLSMKIYIATQFPEKIFMQKGSKEEYLGVNDIGLNHSQNSDVVTKKFVRIIPEETNIKFKVKSGLF